MNKLSIIIPVHNEASILEKEVRSLATLLDEELSDLDYEVLLVENGSRDQTLQIARKLSEQLPVVRVIFMPAPSYGRAVKNGILQSEGNLAAILNIDFWDIEFIKKSLDLFKQGGCDMVLGSKTMPGAKDLRSPLRRIITRSLNFLLRWIFRFKGTDTHGMKVLLRSRVISIIEQCLTECEIFDTEMVLRAQYQGLSIKEIPVVCVEKRPSTLITGNFLRIFKLGWRTIRDLTIVFFSTRGVSKIMGVYGQIRRKCLWICLALAILFMNVFSLINLTTKPGVWYDEGINIELARNFAEFGRMDLMVEPSKFSGLGVLIASTGYPVTIPLAGFFKLFGFGFAQARIYMLFWMSLALLVVFWFAGKRAGGKAAAAAVLLTATFPSFYGNGRSVMGEIPGFVFTILFLDKYLSRKNLWLTGALLGLAVISKPSVFFYLIPAIVILEAWNRKDSIVRIFKLGMGSLIPFGIWVLLYANHALSAETWIKLRDHFANPYKEAGITSMLNIKNNLMVFSQTPTLIYFLLFAFIIFLAAYFNREFCQKNRPLLLLAGFYSFFAFIFFLKSLGYLRYLIAVQLFCLILLQPSLEALKEKFSFRLNSYRWPLVFLGILLIFQAGYLFTRAKLFYSDAAEKTFYYVEQHFPDSTVGVINIPPVASLIPAERRFQIVDSYGLRGIGVNPLLVEENRLPGVIVLDKNQSLSGKEKEVLERFYRLTEIMDDDIAIYERI